MHKGQEQQLHCCIVCPQSYNLIVINVFVAFCFDSRAQQFFFGDVQELFFFTGSMVDARPLIMQPSFYDYHEGVHEALKKPGVPHRLDYDGCGLLRRGGTWWEARKETSEKKTAMIFQWIFSFPEIVVRRSFPPSARATHILLILRHHGQYGCRATRFVNQDATTWEGSSDPRPCDNFWGVCTTRSALGLQQRVRFPGISAEVD